MHKSGIISFTVLLLLTLISGCVQHNCCGYPVTAYICTKGTDTVYLNSTNYAYNSSIFTDTVNFYYSNGYTVNTNYNSPLWQTTCVTGRKALNKALFDGQVCFEPGEGKCSANEDCE